jgi:hypothetical protein
MAAGSCLFCWYLTEFLGEGKILIAKRAAEAGSWSRLRFKENKHLNGDKHSYDWMQAGIRGLSLWSFTISTSARYLETQHFLASMDNSKSLI